MGSASCCGASCGHSSHQLKWRRHEAAAPVRWLLSAFVGLLLGCSAPAAPVVTSPASSAKPSTLAELANYRGTDREQLLYAGAKQEGSLSWYTTLAGDILADLKTEFEAKYPGVKVQEFRMTNVSVQTQQIVDEYRSNTFKPDIYEAVAINAQVLLEQKYLQPYWSALLASYPDDSQLKGTGDQVYWTFERQSFIGFAYNTNVLPSKAVPRKWQDLANPTLKGMLTLSGTDTGPRTIAALENVAGADFIQQKIWPQNYSIQEVSARALLDLIITGEVASSPSIFRNHVLDSKATGAPIEWVPLEPVPTNTGAVAVMSKAPHPNAAMLWIDFVLGTPGQALFEKRFYGSPTKSYGFSLFYPEGGLSLLEYDTAFRRWTDLMRKGAGKN
jgi:iron(III) transport system substrate-binding protein